MPVVAAAFLFTAFALATFVLPDARRVASDGQGYWVVARDGGVFSFGAAGYHGSPAAEQPDNERIAGMAPTASGRGYWLAASDGEVFAYGDADAPRSAPERLNDRIVGIAGTPSGEGYWLAGADGGMFAFGDADFEGSAAGLRLNRKNVGIAATPSGDGYLLVGEDGGVFAFGDASFRGSTVGIGLRGRIVGIAATRTGDGYWLVGEDGGVFAFGDADFRGSTAGMGIRARLVGIAPTPTGGGYWLAGEDGAVFAFGDATFLGPERDLRLRKRAVGIAALRNADPTIRVLDGPGDDDWVSDSTPRYEGTASDTGGTVDEVEVAVDGGPFSSQGVSCDCDGPSVEWEFEPPSTLSEGSHTLRFRAVDDLGARSSIVTRRLRVDTESPSISLTSGPGDGDEVSDATPELGGTASNAGSGVRRIEASVDGGGFSTEGVVCNGCTSSSVTWSFQPLSDLGDGTHTVGFRAVDRAGNRSSPVEVTFVVDTDQPELTSVAGTAANPVVTATFSEPLL
ncbi:MAG: Ig-like domain-containing protein, partial [Actinomycetota bacterium]